MLTAKGQKIKCETRAEEGDSSAFSISVGQIHLKLKRNNINDTINL